MTDEQRALCEQAAQARQRAYAPFSQFRVGAALRTRAGRIICGVNVENPSYGLTICAERVAIGTAAALGVRPDEIVEVSVCAEADNVSPCGACRQVLAHFCSSDALLFCYALTTSRISKHLVRELLPYAFDLEPAR